MNKKKILSLLLAGCMLAGMLPAALAVEEEPQQTPPTEETTPSEQNTPATLAAPATTGEVPVKAEDFKTVSAGGTYDKDSYTVKATWNEEGGYFDAAVKITNLTAGVNGEGNMGYWCGASIPIPEGATGFKWLYKGYTNKNGAKNLEELQTKLSAITDVTAKGADTTLEFYMTLDRDNNNWVGAQFYKGQANSYEALGAPVYINMHKTEDSSISYPALSGDNLCIAPIKDNGSPAATGLYKEGSYKITPPSTLSTDGVNEVKIEVADLKAHLNAENTQGHWVGLSVKAPENAAKMYYSLGTSEAYISNNKNWTYANLEAGVDGKNASGIAFYANASAEEPNIYGYVQFYTALGERISDPYKFHLDLSGVKLYEEPAFSGKIDNRGYSAITATAFKKVEGKVNTFECDVTGTVDLRKYTVLDTVLQTDFESLLQDTARKGASPLNLLTEVAAKYVKDDLELIFADIDFSGELLKKDQDSYYYIRQINPGMAYAYTTINSNEANLKAGIKASAAQGTRAMFTDGMTFILAKPDKGIAVTDNPVSGFGATDIIIQIAPCASDATAMPSSGVTTFVIHNKLVFEESQAPAETTVEAEVKVDGDTAKAEVAQNAIDADTVTAAAGTKDKTLTIDAKGATVGDAVKKIEVTIPNAAVSALADSTEGVSAKIETNQGTVTLSPDAMQKISTEAKNNDITLIVEETTPVSDTEAAYVVEVKANNAPITSIKDLEQPIVLSFFVGYNRPDNPKLYYVDTENANALVYILSTYHPDTGMLEGETPHLSTYAVKADLGSSATKDGIGAKITVDSTQNKYLTVQVTSNNANALFTLKVTDAQGKVDFYAPLEAKVEVWETAGVPVFTENSAKPNGVTNTVTIEKVTVTP